MCLIYDQEKSQELLEKISKSHLNRITIYKSVSPTPDGFVTPYRNMIIQPVKNNWVLSDRKNIYLRERELELRTVRNGIHCWTKKPDGYYIIGYGYQDDFIGCNRLGIHVAFTRIKVYKSDIQRARKRVNKLAEYKQKVRQYFRDIYCYISHKDYILTYDGNPITALSDLNIYAAGNRIPVGQRDSKEKIQKILKRIELFKIKRKRISMSI